MVKATPRPLYPRKKKPGTHSIGKWLDCRAGQDGCGKHRPHRHLFLILSVYFIRTCFFVCIGLAFAFCPYCTTHNTNMYPPRRDSKPQPHQAIGRRPLLDHRDRQGFDPRTVQPIEIPIPTTLSQPPKKSQYTLDKKIGDDMKTLNSTEKRTQDVLM